MSSVERANLNFSAPGSRACFRVPVEARSVAFRAKERYSNSGSTSGRLSKLLRPNDILSAVSSVDASGSGPLLHYRERG